MAGRQGTGISASLPSRGALPAATPQGGGQGSGSRGPGVSVLPSTPRSPREAFSEPGSVLNKQDSSVVRKTRGPAPAQPRGRLPPPRMWFC